MQNVIEKILEEAKKEAAEITKKYHEEAQKIKNEYEEKLRIKSSEIAKEIEKLKSAEILRTLAKEKLFLSKKLTMERHQYINEVIQSALKRLPEHSKYFNFLKELIKKSDEKEGELLLTKHDLNKYGAQLEKFISVEGLNYRITAEDGVDGGVIIKRDKITYLGSLDLIRELLRSELEITVAEILFKK